MAEKYTFLDLAKEVLESAKIPLTGSGIWSEAEGNGLQHNLNSKGKTPCKTLEAQLYVNVKREDSIFCIASKKPTAFWLKSRMSELENQKFQEDLYSHQIKQDKERKQSPFDERDLHPLLVKFVSDSPEFNLYCKTIFHEKSQRVKNGKNRWIHPDIVGVHFLFEFHKQTLTLLRHCNEIPYELYSFELKKRLDFANLRECYFQAVSNSSWANEGYLVVLDYDESQEFEDELWRLGNAFGIGVIKLNTGSLLESKVIVPARQKEKLDFETIDLLVGGNLNFKKFIESINHNVEVKSADYIFDKDYDEVFDDEKMEKYLKEKKII